MVLARAGVDGRDKPGQDGGRRSQMTNFPGGNL
jgi:hypothetical protein